MSLKSLILSSVLLACATAAHAEMKITSTDMTEGGTLKVEQVANVFGCTGGNISPQLSWSGAPDGTKSFALMVYDPDAPTGSGWWHWTVFNIPASVHELAANAGSGTGLPDGAVQGRTDAGQPGYGGACPPEGAAPHRYQFTIFALSADALPLDNQASAAMLGFMANGMALDKATLTVTYGR